MIKQLYKHFTQTDSNIENNLIKIIKEKIKKKKGVYFLIAEQEKQLNIIFTNSLTNINEKTLIKKANQFIPKSNKKLNFKSTGEKQTISIGTSLIPFLQHNDANRTLMGATMQKQAVEIKGKESPIIETGIEKEIAKNNTLVETANESGIIKFINTKKIVICTNREKRKIKIMNKTLLYKAKGKFQLEKKTKDWKMKVKITILKKNKESNLNIHNDLFTFKNKFNGDILYSTSKYQVENINGKEFIPVFKKPLNPRDRRVNLIAMDAIEKVKL